MKKILVKFKEFWQNNKRMVIFYVALSLVLIFAFKLPSYFCSDNLSRALGENCVLSFGNLVPRIILALPFVVFLIILRNIKKLSLLAEFVIAILIFGSLGFFLSYAHIIERNIISGPQLSKLLVISTLLFGLCIIIFLRLQDRLSTFLRILIYIPIIFCEMIFGLFVGYLVLELQTPPPPPIPFYWPGGCFVEGTLVWTPDGMSSIESIKRGNIVYAFDTTLSTIVEATVGSVIRKTRAELLIIDDDLQVTPEHPMAVTSDGNIVWKEAGELSVGECLVSQTGSCVNIRSITHQNLVSPIPVINLSVSAPNNFFVIMGDKPVLVHNKTVPAAM